MQALPCRALGTASPVRSIVVVQGGAVLTGHEDGNVRAWKPDGSGGWQETDGACWRVQVKMHNTAVTCLAPSRNGSVWTASAAGSIRQIGLDGARNAVECKAPGSKSAHNTGITALVVTGVDTLWSGARNVRVWTAGGEWRQSLQTHAGKVTAMAVAPAAVWVAFSDGRLRLFEQESAVCIQQLQDDGKHSQITCLVASPHVMWAGTAEGNVSCFALDSQRQLLEAPVMGKVGVGAIGATRRAIWVGGDRCIYTYIHPYIYIYIYVHIYTYVYIYVYIYIYMCVCIYVYTHTHTHTEGLWCPCHALMKRLLGARHFSAKILLK